MKTSSSRREFVKHSLFGTALAGAAWGVQAAAGAADDIALPAPLDLEPEGSLPQGKIGSLSVSRILLGGNLLPTLHTVAI